MSSLKKPHIFSVIVCNILFAQDFHFRIQQSLFITALDKMAAVETSSRSIKFSEEFRQVVYKINPDYLSCTHKTLFEINATDSLRNQEADFQIYTNDSTERRKPGYDVNEMKYPSTSMSNIAGTYSDSALKVLPSNYISNDRRVSVMQ